MMFWIRLVLDRPLDQLHARTGVRPDPEETLVSYLGRVQAARR